MLSKFNLSVINNFYDIKAFLKVRISSHTFLKKLRDIIETTLLQCANDKKKRRPNTFIDFFLSNRGKQTKREREKEKVLFI